MNGLVNGKFSTFAVAR